MILVARFWGGLNFLLIWMLLVRLIIDKRTVRVHGIKSHWGRFYVTTFVGRLGKLWRSCMIMLNYNYTLKRPDLILNLIFIKQIDMTTTFFQPIFGARFKIRFEAVLGNLLLSKKICLQKDWYLLLLWNIMFTIQLRIQIFYISKA